MRKGLLAGLILVGTGCFLDPTCQDACEGDRIASCRWKCSGQGKIDIPECEREYGGTDCSQKTGASGGPMTCRMRELSGSPARPTCVDVNLPPCDPRGGSVQCTGPHTIASCFALTPEQGYLQPIPGSDGGVCEPDRSRCHMGEHHWVCAAQPLAPCDPSGGPFCASDSELRRCDGRPDGGFYAVHVDCAANPNSSRCEGDAGVARCQ